MNKGLLIRLLTSIFILAGFFYAYIDRQNDLTELKIQIPELMVSLRVLEEENAQLTLEIERLENPNRLIKLLREKEYSHLRYPYLEDVVMIERDRI